METPRHAVKAEITVPPRTVGTVFIAILLAKAAAAISTLFLPLLLSTLLAISLHPIAKRLERWGLGRKSSVAILLCAFFLGCALIGSIVLPRLYDEAALFIERFPEIKQHAVELIPSGSPFRAFAERGLKQATITPKNLSTDHVLTAGTAALGGLTEVLLVIVFTSYLVMDGPKIAAWIAAFFRRDTSEKLRQTFREISAVVSAYVAGQFVTSAFAFAFTFVALSLLGVPSAVLLATLAAIFDILPVLGFFLAVIPAMLFAIRVEEITPLYVLGLYLFYHSLENYWIAPLVYGSRMRLSSFVVLVSLIIAGLIGGIEGAIIVLPIVASYPIIERIWLRPVVSDETVKQHAKIGGAA